MSRFRLSCVHVELCKTISGLDGKAASGPQWMLAVAQSSFPRPVVCHSRGLSGLFRMDRRRVSSLRCKKPKSRHSGLESEAYRSVTGGICLCNAERNGREERI